jgi:hypothetical protein
MPDFQSRIVSIDCQAARRNCRKTSFPQDFQIGSLDKRAQC